MNMEQSSNSVAELPFSETETYIDSSSDKETDVAMEFVLNPPTFVVTSSEWTSPWFTNHSSFVVLDELKDLDLSVVAANTVGVTSV